MDLESLYKYEDQVYPKGVFAFLEKIFKESDAVNWLLNSFDEKLGKCLKRAMDKMNESLKENSLNAFLYLVDGIIPNIKSTTHDSAMVERLIEKVVHPLLFCFLLYTKWKWPVLPQISSLLERIVYFAPYHIISDEKLFLGEKFVKSLIQFLRVLGSLDVLIHQKIFCILMKRLMDKDREKLFTPENIFFYRRLANHFPEFTCLLNEVCHQNDVEQIFLNRFQVWKLLTKCSDAFQSNKFELALKQLIPIVTEKPPDIFIAYLLLDSKIFYHLEKMLTMNEDFKENNVKLFLELFLNISPCKSNMWVIGKKNTFKRLIKNLIITIEKLVKEAYLRRLIPKEMKDYQSQYIIEILDNDISSTVNLLNCLYKLNSTWYQWFELSARKPVIDGVKFISKVITKFYELEFLGYIQPNIYIQWFSGIIKKCPAVLPYSTRLNFLSNHILEYPYDRRRMMFNVSRKGAIKCMQDLFRRKKRKFQHLWVFKFRNEIGEGPGINKEFYSLISRELQEYEKDMWNVEPTEKSNEGGAVYVYSPDGIFPKASTNVSKRCEQFRFLGKLMAKSVHDEHLLNLPLSDWFFQRLMGDKTAHLKKEYYDIPSVFPITKVLFEDLVWIKCQKAYIESNSSLSKAEKLDMIQKLTFSNGSSFEDLWLNFTLPGSNVELIKGGADEMLSPLNVEQYLEALCSMKSKTDPSAQFEAIIKGFNHVFPIDELNLFYPEELKRFWVGEENEDWTVEYLEENCGFDEYYAEHSQPVQFLFQVLTSFSATERKMFIQFVTGLSSLPIGGLEVIEPVLAVVRICYDDPDQQLPSSSTCQNILFLPEYKSLEKTREKLLYAISEGCNSFELV